MNWSDGEVDHRYAGKPEYAGEDYRAMIQTTRSSAFSNMAVGSTSHQAEPKTSSLRAAPKS
jgi:hypothetical protein